MISKEGLVEKIPGVGTRSDHADTAPIRPGQFALLSLSFAEGTKEHSLGGSDYRALQRSLFYSIENECKKRGYSLIYTTLDEDESLAEILKTGKSPASSS